MPVLAVIPARLGSTRLPHKPLQVLAGEPLVVRVARHVQELALTDRVVVATDGEQVAEAVRRAGFTAVLTEGSHRSGTDRVAEVMSRREYREFEVVVNLQGDEPFLPREALAGALERLAQGDEVGTAAAPLDPSEANDPSRVKVVMDLTGRALYFSRSPIPWRGNDAAAPPDLYWQHLGVYAFRRPALARWVTLGPSPLEAIEGLEQLRAMEHGFRIGVARLERPAPPAVDTREDLARAEAYWHRRHGEAG